MVYVDGYFKEILYLILCGKCWNSSNNSNKITKSSNNYDYSNRTLRPFVIHDHEIWKRIKIEHELSEDTSDIVRTSNIKFHDLSSCKTLVYNPHPLHIVTMIFLEAPTASVHETNTRTKV